MVTQEGWPRGSGDRAVLMIYEALWLLPAPRGRSSEGAAWVARGPQQLCGGYRFVLPPPLLSIQCFPVAV